LAQTNKLLQMQHSCISDSPKNSWTYKSDHVSLLQKSNQSIFVLLLPSPQKIMHDVSQHWSDHPDHLQLIIYSASVHRYYSAHEQKIKIST
jgi:hypothetical protein